MRRHIAVRRYVKRVNPGISVDSVPDRGLVARFVRCDKRNVILAFRSRHKGVVRYFHYAVAIRYGSLYVGQNVYIVRHADGQQRILAPYNSLGNVRFVEIGTDNRRNAVAVVLAVDFLSVNLVDKYACAVAGQLAHGNRQYRVAFKTIPRIDEVLAVVKVAHKFVSDVNLPALVVQAHVDNLLSDVNVVCHTVKAVEEFCTSAHVGLHRAAVGASRRRLLRRACANNAHVLFRRRADQQQYVVFVVCAVRQSDGDLPHCRRAHCPWQCHKRNKRVVLGFVFDVDCLLVGNRTIGNGC